jgi:tRNA threonylcarbamoyladenosine biosynthesis protein TsaE
MTSVKDEAAMRSLGNRLGNLFRGGEVIELVGDVGAGKTTLVKGIGEGMKVEEYVQSPSFTISRVYPARDNLELHHYDFYRLNDPGVMSFELAESVSDAHAVTVVEWGETVHEVLPRDHVVMRITYTPDGNGRELRGELPEDYSYLKEALR